MNIRRYAWSTIFLLLVLMAVTGCNTKAGSVVAEPKKSGSEIRIYEVFGMDCPGCHGGLEKLIERIEGIESARANWQKKLLVVKVKPGHKLDDNDVFKAIRSANFTPGKRKK